MLALTRLGLIAKWVLDKPHIFCPAVPELLHRSLVRRSKPTLPIPHVRRTPFRLAGPPLHPLCVYTAVVHQLSTTMVFTVPSPNLILRSPSAVST
jgi:hypothetical protein